MCDLLRASSAYPPLVPAVEFEGERVVTGELVDPVPVDLVADVPGQTLVLTTRTYNRKTPVFAMEGRIYVQPSAPVPVASWDFTSARRFQQTYELGRQDAEAFLELSFDSPEGTAHLLDEIAMEERGETIGEDYF